MTLKRPDYIEYDKIGRMIRLFCAVCGTVIGEDRRGNFFRFTNYAELKMKFDNGQMHVTNLCTDCVVVVAQSPELMLEVYHADIDEMATEIPEMGAFKDDKGLPRYVTMDLTRSGLP